MIPGRSIETVQPCGIVVRSDSGVVDICDSLGDDTPDEAYR